MGSLADAVGMIGFARACDAVAATTAKSVKVERLGCYLSSLDEEDLAAAARFCSGYPLPASDTRKLAIGGRTLASAARRVWGIDQAALSLAYRETGDLGDALGRFVRGPNAPSLFDAPLTPASFAQLLDEVASASGRSAGKQRELLCERILRSCREEREAAYAVKILTGELRIGLREGLVLEAIAGAFERDVAGVRRAAMAAGDVGAVAVAARNGALEQIELHYGRPIGFMLASPIAFGSSYRELGDRKWIVEDKYDGIRVQAHKTGSSVRLFTRTFSEISRAFPEVASALAGSDGDLILDGEIVARRDGRVLPFRYLQTRLQRVDPSAQLLAQTPAAFVAFDAIAANQHFLLERTLTERRAELVERVRENDHAIVSPWLELEVAASPARLAALYEAARERGNEGLMLKRADAPYLPGRRGKWWLKLKRELSTLDVVIVGVEWGHGKRAKVLSDYTFAVRGPNDDLLTIGKAYSGLTDAEIAALTPWFLEHRIDGRSFGRAFAVEPRIVLEVAFDIVQKSTLHQSGYSLRFPRIVRIRDDKPVAEIDTLANVDAIYEAMLERERGD